MPPVDPEIVRISQECERVILSVVKDELFPSINKLKELLNQIQKCRISYQLYSFELHRLEKEFDLISTDFYGVDTKLNTPDTLFQGIHINEGPQYAAAAASKFMQFKPAIERTAQEGSNYLEVIDRTLDRKRQKIQSNITTILAVVAILVSILIK